jgi:hypothetical protein
VKIFITIFCLAVLAGTVLAQDVGVTWGADQKMGSKSHTRHILGEDGNGFYTVRTVYKFSSIHFYIERHVLKDMSLAFSKEIILPEFEGKTAEFEDIKFVNGSIILFTSFYSKAENINFAFAETIDPDGIQRNDRKEIDRIEVIKSKYRGEFEFVRSKDSTKVMVYHNKPFEKYSNEAFSYKVYDHQLNKLWGKDIELPYKDRNFHISDYILDAEGNIFMITEFSPERKKGENTTRGIPNNKYIILAYYHIENKLKEFDISLGGKWVSSVTFTMAPNGDLAIGGFYSNDRYFSIAGTFYLTIDQHTKKIKAQSLKAFDNELLKEFLSEKSIEKGRELPSFYFDHFIVRKDGSVLFVAEQYYVTISSFTDPRTGLITSNYNYYYNHLIVVNINADGSIKWAKKVPKRQYTSNDHGFFSSYAMATTGDKIHLLYNDNPKNEPLYKTDPDKIKSMNNPKKSIAMLVSIDNEGNVSRKPLFNTKDQSVILRPKLYSQTTSNGVILYGQKGKTYRFGRLEF